MGEPLARTGSLSVSISSLPVSLHILSLSMWLTSCFKQTSSSLVSDGLCTGKYEDLVLSKDDILLTRTFRFLHVHFESRHFLQFHVAPARQCVMYLTYRFHVAMRQFSNRSQMTSKCGIDSMLFWVCIVIDHR